MHIACRPEFHGDASWLPGTQQAASVITAADARSAGPLLGRDSRLRPGGC